MGDLVLVLDLVIMYYILVILASLAYCLAQMIDPKAGQTLSPSFTCGKYTTRTVLIGASTTSVVASQKGTMRCTVLYKLTSCKRGDTFTVKSKGCKPKAYCKRNKPNDRYPAISDGNMKMWYTAKGGKRYPKKGFS